MTQLWLPGFWRPMAFAPRDCTWIEVELRDGRVTRAHYACGDGDGLMPPFDGFFEERSGIRGFWGVYPIAWRPIDGGS